MDRKLGINSNCIRGMKELDVLPLIKEAGFVSFFTQAYTVSEVTALKEQADKLGLFYESVHAPFRGINPIWLSGMDYLPIYRGLKESIDACAQNDIPIVVMHLSSGWKAPEINDLGLARYDALVEYAAERGVTIAFENLRKIGNVAYFADRYANVPNVGFCYDCGHEHCYTKYISWPDIFRNRIVFTHIHDNLGRGDEETGDPDLHWLPFDGTKDYAFMMRQLDRYGYEGTLSLEAANHTRPEYLAMTPKDFLATCYERAAKIAKM